MDHNVILVDVSSFIFRHIFATIRYYKLRNEIEHVKILSASFKNILHKNFLTKLDRLQRFGTTTNKKSKKPEKIQRIFCYDGKLSRTWRYKMFPSYKKGRSTNPDLSILFKELFDVARTHEFTHFKMSNVEADDLIAILAIQYDKHFQLFKNPPTISIISDDHDMYQLKGYCSTVSLYGNDLKQLNINKQKANEILDRKIIKGDPSDRIPSAKKNGNDLNRTLIDFRCIPQFVTNSVLNQYLKFFKKGRAKTKILLTLPPIFPSTVLFRPSRQIKSPYLCDVLSNKETLMVHSPSLGMSGMIIKDTNVLISKIEKPKKASHRIQLVRHENEWIGAIPLYANTIVKAALENGWLMKYDKLQCEHKIGDSRIDFFIRGKCNYLLEVKSVILKKDNVAYFPDGYKKSGDLVVSERALKHVLTLQKYARNNKNDQAWLIFLVQRNDIDYFRLNVERDPYYARAVLNALHTNVVVRAFKICWTEMGCRGWKEIPIIW